MQQQSNIQTTCLEIALPKDIIEYNLQCLAPDVQVIGSQFTEDGFVLVLEGDPGQLADLIYLWGEAAK